MQLNVKTEGAETRKVSARNAHRTGTPSFDLLM